MRILEVVHGFPPEATGGTELYARAHARALRVRTGDEVLVLTRDNDPGRAEYDVRTDTVEGLQVFRVNNTFRDVRSFDGTYRSDAVGAIASRLIDDFRPDIAHIHHLTCLSTTIVRSLGARRVPCVMTLHDYWLMCHRGQLLDVNGRVCEGPPCHACLGTAGAAAALGFAGATALRALERRLPEATAHRVRHLAERVAATAFGAGGGGGRDAQEQLRLEHMRSVCADVTHFLAPSEHIRDAFVRWGMPADRITVSRYGVDSAACRTRPSHQEASRSDKTGSVPGRPLRLGFLGSLMVSKAPHLLLEAAARLPSGSVSVDLYGGHTSYHGDDTYREKLEPLLEGRGVRAHGPVAHEQVPHALASLDVLVVPSIWPENSPFVIHEAFLAGVPVVASRIGGIPELVEDGRNGLLFRAGDVDDLVRVLERLLREISLVGALRAGIPAVRSIGDDVGFARGLYERLCEQPVPSPSARRRVAAIVLNFRTPDQTLLTVKALLASRRSIHDVIVVDNDSGEAGAVVDAARGALRGVWSNIRYILTGRNLGFSGGMNAGIREALARGAERVLLVNSDVIVPPDTVQRLEDSLDRTAGAGIAGPAILARSAPDTIASLGMSYAPVTGRMRHRANGERADVRGLPASDEVVDGVSGCVMLVNRDVFDAAGLLDEEYFFSFEDLDFCLRARRAGFASVLAAGAVVYHEGGRSLGATSTRRFYFAARNHLRLAQRAGAADGRLASAWRAGSILALNLAHAVVSPGGSLVARVGAVVRGTWDYVAGRFGSGS